MNDIIYILTFTGNIASDISKRVDAYFLQQFFVVDILSDKNLRIALYICCYSQHIGVEACS